MLLSRTQSERIRDEFDIFKTRIHDKPLVYLDSAASAQKPRVVHETMNHFYQQDYSNVHRGLHTLSERATERYESVRDQVADFIGAKDPKEIIFTSGTTAAINAVAQCFSALTLSAGDHIVITAMEHHANIVPWQVACERYGAELVVIPLAEDGTIRFSDFQKAITDKTRLIACTHVSNVLGTINPIEQWIDYAHANGVPVLIDGAQGIVHCDVDVAALGCDFYIFSAHKLYGPTGVGVLYGQSKWLTAMPPYQYGGEMIDHVTFEKTTYAGLPNKFEAGTPNIAGVIGLGAALSYLSQYPSNELRAHEMALTIQLLDGLSQIDGVTVYGPSAQQRVGLAAFSVQGVHAHDLGLLLDRRGIAVRVGHHCAQPLMARLGVPATIRASLGMYSLAEDVDALLTALPDVIQCLR